MNDTRDKSTGVEIHYPAYFYVNETWFDFFRLLPDFNVFDVYERRLTFGPGRQLTIQIADGQSFLHVTVYCFSAR